MKLPDNNVRKIRGRSSRSATHSDTFCPTSPDGEPEWLEIVAPMLAGSSSEGSKLLKRYCAHCGTSQ